MRLLIAAAACVCALLMVRVEGLLRESFIAHITDVRTLSRVLSLVYNQMTFASELHVTVGTRMISNIFVHDADMLT